MDALDDITGDRLVACLCCFNNPLTHSIGEYVHIKIYLSSRLSLQTLHLLLYNKCSYYNITSVDKTISQQYFQSPGQTFANLGGLLT